MSGAVHPNAQIARDVALTRVAVWTKRSEAE
jgi:hypothetical protein